LDAAFGGKGTKTSRQRNRLHQGGFLAHDVRTRPQDLAGDENFGL